MHLTQTTAECSHSGFGIAALASQKPHHYFKATHSNKNKKLYTVPFFVLR
jgi:hypothetical protein